MNVNIIPVENLYELYPFHLKYSNFKWNGYNQSSDQEEQDEETYITLNKEKQYNSHNIKFSSS